MVNFCDQIVREIKASKNEAELIKIISSSLHRLQSSGNHNEEGYIMKMIVSLRALSVEGLPAETLNNVKLATAIFRQFQQGKPVRIPQNPAH